LLSSYKNIISWVIKIAVGLLSFYFIYDRLQSEFTAEKLIVIQSYLSSPSAYILLFCCLIFVPINWGIESYKWQMITAPVEQVSYGTASKSVYAGLCVGNLAPGRATEFLAKILFFTPQHRTTITLLHFANGMFQLAVTILFGGMAVIVFYQDKLETSNTKTFLTGLFCIVLLSVFTFFITRFHYIQKWIVKKFERSLGHNAEPYTFTKNIIFKLFAFSVIRYIVFTFQFVLLIKIFYADAITSQLVAGICIYFLLTTILPMISFIEAAIRSAIALFVFSGSNVPEMALVITAILLWVLNVVLPSIVGYIIIVKEKFEFSLFKK
jgi:hypothetical protein